MRKTHALLMGALAMAGMENATGKDFAPNKQFQFQQGLGRDNRSFYVPKKHTRQSYRSQQRAKTQRRKQKRGY